MPYTFLFICAAVGSLIVAPAVFLITFILCSCRKTDSEKPRIVRRLVLSLLLSVLAAVVLPISILLLGAIVVFIDFYGHGDYWRDDGCFDSYRMPLEFPYELISGDACEYAQIDVWKQDTPSELTGITQFEKRGVLIFGQKVCGGAMGGPDKKEWFLFDLSSGQKMLFKGEEEFVSELKQRGIERIKLKKFLQNWEEYWKEPRREAGGPAKMAKVQALLSPAVRALE